MDLRDHLLEVQLRTEKNINTLFNIALRQIFEPSYLKKIDGTLHNTIKMQEVDDRHQNIIAYNKGSTIYINKRPFGALTTKKKMNYILHEFVHVLQNMKRFFLFRGFKEIHNMTSDLYDIVDSNLVKSYPEFLTGKKVKIGSGGKFEILAYLMNNSIDWTAITPEAKKKFIATLREYDIFNLENQFWHDRLN
jgi:hypothetical protein